MRSPHPPHGLRGRLWGAPGERTAKTLLGGQQLRAGGKHTGCPRGPGEGLSLSAEGVQGLSGWLGALRGRTSGGEAAGSAAEAGGGGAASVLCVGLRRCRNPRGKARGESGAVAGPGTCPGDRSLGIRASKPAPVSVCGRV